MAKKARQRISYVLESAKSPEGGHRLGVNGLAVDTNNGILYSGGRDGIVCAWDLDLDLKGSSSDTRDSADKPRSRSKFRAQAQPHTHWINDITLAQSNTALVTASSDLTVKVWRPHSEEDSTRTVTIGEHADYVKCVATPPAAINANWVATGGLDRKLCLWDLNGAGKTLEVDVRGEEKPEKGSVYALAVGRDIMACGGPEKMVRLHDTRTGKKVSKLVGHLDMIRSILIDDSGDIILSASSDKTIKMWSVKGGRCMYTFTMHDESVWSLFSDDPSLGIFYSSDRAGLVAKTDVRGTVEDLDNGLSLAIAEEHCGVCKVVAAAGHIWTATNRSSINRWGDVDTNTDTCLPEPFRRQRTVSAGPDRLRQALPTNAQQISNQEIPSESILRMSNTAVFPARGVFDSESNKLSETLTRRGSEVVVEQVDPEVKPIHQTPEETIQGQFGLLKHKMLNDRRRVLTLDTAGDVLLWDLLACKPVQSFGKQNLEDVEVVVNTREAVAPWCSVDLSSGNLTVVLEPFNCFDAEMYADELKLDEPIDFKEDQRISLGRWILRYLFSNLIDEEIKRDEGYRQKLNEEVSRNQAAGRANAPTSIDIPPSNISNWHRPDQLTTPRANGSQLHQATPGLGIGLATPAPGATLPGVPEEAVCSPLSPAERGAAADRDDYFTGGSTVVVPGAPATESSEAKNLMDNGNEKGKDKASDVAKSPGSTFGKKLRMSFSSKKLGRSSSQATQDKPVVVDEKAEESESSSTDEKEVDDSFLGVIQKIRNDYDKQLADTPEKFIETRVMPSLPNETPVLKLPPGTKIIIQEETSGGSANVYQGTVENVGRDADIIEQRAPMWLGDVLLQNIVPFKEPVKISFVLHPIGDLMALSPADGNNRLNANRMLRVKKILAYVAERIEEVSEEPDANSLSPEEYLELYCNDQLLDPLMSLATIRAHVWKSGNDVVLYYKANGRKEIIPPKSTSSMIPADTPGAPGPVGAPGASSESTTSTATAVA
ncbi:WD repeat protein [Metarhizium album ARSEF 1941]|uniref:WD repeat protein n=1 Tax=Metarhizium album (strain ARSEF 1941) TaxID=1081103 RepID=A0A0B2WY84_METAS|nr:WD repeat protein [Metarhizium album ARSEF 1941]KHN97790.1 WD repeat protein [Metarhizium album ARSEF 1941]